MDGENISVRAQPLHRTGHRQSDNEEAPGQYDSHTVSGFIKDSDFKDNIERTRLFYERIVLQP